MGDLLVTRVGVDLGCCRQLSSRAKVCVPCPTGTVLLLHRGEA